MSLKQDPSALYEQLDRAHQRIEELQQKNQELEELLLKVESLTPKPAIAITSKDACVINSNLFAQLFIAMRNPKLKKIKILMANGVATAIDAKD